MIKTVYICDICGAEYTTPPDSYLRTAPAGLPPNWDYIACARGSRRLRLICAACRRKAQKEWEETHGRKETLSAEG